MRTLKLLPHWLLAGVLSLLTMALHAQEHACAAEAQTRAASQTSGHRGLTVLMVLSPRMPYALQEWHRMKTVAERAGFTVVGRRDPRVADTEWMVAAETTDQPELMHLPALDESYAAANGLLNHSPASLVMRCGRAHPWPVLGVMPDQAWLSVLRHRAEQLESASCC